MAESMHPLLLCYCPKLTQAASVQDTMSGQASSTAAILRTSDALAEALRDEASMDLDDIARINRVMSPTYDASSIPGAPTEDLFSAQDKSTTTQPTSIDTSLPNITYNGKGKARVEASNASSLSVACGSASEAEAQRPDVRREALLAVGDWATATFVSEEPLRGAARAKTRRHRIGPRKIKKPVVEIVQHIEPGNVSLVENREATVTVAAAYNGPGTSSPCLSESLHVLTRYQKKPTSANVPLSTMRTIFGSLRRAKLKHSQRITHYTGHCRGLGSFF
jgi:hypothetical protein